MTISVCHDAEGMTDFQTMNGQRLTSRTSWLPVLDGAVVVLLLLTACVFVFGGFREHLGTMRISVRSADRPLVLAIALLLFRHLLVPSPNITTSVRDRVSRIWSSEARATVLSAFVATRVSVLLVGYLALVTIGIEPGTARFNAAQPTMLEDLLARWDAAWYLSIATQGYRWDGNPLREQNVVFFPLYPSAMRALGLFLGNHWLVAGLLLALTGFLAALTYLYRLAADLLDTTRAQTVVWALAA